METSKIINVAVAKNPNGQWYYNLNTNTFDSADNYSISDNVEAYSVTDLYSVKDAWENEFSADTGLHLEKYDTIRNEFVD